MALPATSYTPNKQVQIRIRDFVRACSLLMRQNYNIREEMLTVDRSYMREVDETMEQFKAKRANRAGDTNKFQNIVIPVVMPQVEAAVTYQTSVFLTGYPIFGVVADPKNMEAALQMDTIIGEQQIRGGWVNEYQKTFRNGFKYNLMATLVDWDREVTFSLENQANQTDAKLQEVMWSGNRIRNLDLYNTVMDPRVKPSEISKEGEFAGFTELKGYVALTRFLQSLPNAFNIEDALASTFVGTPSSGADSTSGYFIPDINKHALIMPDTMSGFNWMAWAGMDEGMDSTRARFYHGMFQVTTMYARIIPKMMGMSGRDIVGPNIPQIWKFIIVNDAVVVSAERQSNAHQLLPVCVAQPYDDGLGYQTKSLAINVGPIQEITTALSNSSIAARRRAVGDRMLYDSSRISAGMINNDNPMSKIPVKPSAFGSTLEQAVYPIPFRDELFQINQAEMGGYLQMANQISGMNPARQGQFVKGNKTRSEFDQIMANANGRDQTVALSIEASLMTPTKEIIKANILQYQGGVDLYNREQQTAVTVDPIALRKAMLVFKMSDGSIPSEKLIDSQVMQVAFQSIQNNPALGAGYNITPMFSYLMKSAGAKISPFEKSSEQVAYEQAANQWQQTIMGAAAELAKNNEITPEMLQQMTQNLPPQPTPEQFGYNPQQQLGSEAGGGQSILTQVTQNAAQAGGSSGDVAGPT